jgi:glycosyltransferase involved in cell wall biosynthesis
MIAAATWTGSYAGRRLVDVFLPVSEAAARANGLLDRGLPVRIVPNFLPESASPCDRQEIDRYLARLPREPFLLFVGAFGAYKGVDVLLQAYSELNDAPPLVLIGYETAESPVQTRALPRNVTVLKDWPHAAVMEAWQRSLMAIVPSIVAETFGMVALEAMSVGRAVIASRIGGLPDIVADRQTGLLVPPGDAIALRSAIQTLLDDVDLRDRLGRAGRESARRFSARTVVSEYEQIYAGMIDGKTFDGAGEINPLPVMMEARP